MGATVNRRRLIQVGRIKAVLVATRQVGRRGLCGCIKTYGRFFERTA